MNEMIKNMLTVDPEKRDDAKTILLKLKRILKIDYQ